MVSFSEKSFGARLLNAQNVLTYIQGFANYHPPQVSDAALGLKAFLDDIIEANMIETESEQQYRAAVKKRQDAFKGEGSSVLKLLARILGAVDATYSKDSQQSVAIRAIIGKMRATKLTPPPAPAAEGATPAAAISNSQQSYGSLIQFFSDIISTLGQFGSYDPSNPELKIPSLQIFLATLHTLNAAVAQKYETLTVQRKKRADLYDDLAAMGQRIKAYIKSQYGLDSNEYELVKGLRM